MLATSAAVLTAASCSSTHRSESSQANSSTTSTTSTIPADCLQRPDQTGPPPGFVITAHNTIFDRMCIKIASGRMELVLNNRDAGVGYSLTVFDPAGQKIIGSEVLTGPRVFALNFQVASGIYRYHCDIHPQLMHGIIVVT